MKSTREAAAYLARRLAARPLLLLLAWRREDLPVSALAVADDLSGMAGATVLSLGRLDRAAIGDIVAAGSVAGATDVDPATLDASTDALFAESEGLPLYVRGEALSRAGIERAPVRHGVEAMLRERLASVSETAVQVVSAAAVIGRSFTLRRSGQPAVGPTRKPSRRSKSCGVASSARWEVGPSAMTSSTAGCATSRTRRRAWLGVGCSTGVGRCDPGRPGRPTETT